MSNPYDISGPNHDLEQETFKYFASHLVALAGLYQPLSATGTPKGEANCFFYSGFVMAIRRRWYFVTAGHIIQNLETKIKKRAMTVQECRLIDTYGLGACHHAPIPFDYTLAYKRCHYSETDGLDFGLVEIDANQQRLLKANRIAVISKKDWTKQKSLTFEGFFILGLPEDCIHRDTARNRNGYSVQGNAVPNMIYLRAVKRPKKEWCRPFDRFIGRIPAKHKATVGDIDGMSGGPIFGFAKEEPGHHYIVAVQSAWLPKEGITFGCPIPVLAEHAERLLKQDGR